MNTLKTTGIALALATVVSFAPLSNAAEPQASTPQIFYRTVEIDGLEIFYREVGRKDAPTVLLLHGFPTSSHMFRNLLPALSDKYHVIAPDYPGYHNAEGQWLRAYGNELWEFDDEGLMRRREASINDVAIKEEQRKFHWSAHDRKTTPAFPMSPDLPIRSTP